MKKIISILGLGCIFILTVLLTAATLQQGKGKGNQQEHGNKPSGHQENNGHQDIKNKEDHGHTNDRASKGNVQKNDKAEEKNGQRNNKEAERENNGNINAKANHGKGPTKKGADYYQTVSDYHWNKENFQERNNYRQQEKVTLCHKISKGNGDGVEITVSEKAVKAHLNHGDVLGSCPTYNRPYSDIFYSERHDYYNTLQNTQEQVAYSRSILDYALERLAYGKAELATLQNNNAPVSVIQGRQESVNQLQQNVSVLQTLLGVAVQVIANKLQ